MFAIRSTWSRVAALLLAVGALALVPGRPASADQFLRFRQELSLVDARLDEFDAFGSFWAFKGKLLLDTTWAIRDQGDCEVAVAAFVDAPGLNYKLGVMHRMEVFMLPKVFPCHLDRIDGMIHAHFPLEMLLRGPGGGRICPVMSVVLTPDGAKVLDTDFRANKDQD